MEADDEAEAGGFGEALSFHLEQHRIAKEQETSERATLTQVIEDVAGKSGVSAAHIMRIKGRAAIPSRNTLKRLAEAIPALNIYLKELAPLKADWTVVEKHQEDLSPGSTITVVAGKKPHVIDDDVPDQEKNRMALLIAQNIINRRIGYTFVLEGAANVELAELRIPQVAFGQWIASGGASGERTLEEWKDEIEQGIHVVTVGSDAPHFWASMPRYSVFYNLRAAELGEAERLDHSRFGMYWARGVSPFVRRPTNLAAIHDPRLRWQGWVLLDPDDFSYLSQNIISHLGDRLRPPTSATASNASTAAPRNRHNQPRN